MTGFAFSTLQSTGKLCPTQSQGAPGFSMKSPRRPGRGRSEGSEEGKESERVPCGQSYLQRSCRGTAYTFKIRKHHLNATGLALSSKANFPGQQRDFKPS